MKRYTLNGEPLLMILQVGNNPTFIFSHKSITLIQLKAIFSLLYKQNALLDECEYMYELLELINIFENE